MREKIERMVRKVVSDYFLKDKEKQVQRKVLILLENQTFNDPDSVWETVRSIARNYETTICFSEKWSTTPDDIKHVKQIPLSADYLDEIKRSMQKADVLFVATASYSTIAKLALTIDDELGMWITIQMQFYGKKLILASDQCMQKGTQKITTPYTVSKRLQTYFKQLREDKVHFVGLQESSAWLDTYFEGFTHNRHVVLARHIEEAVSHGELELIVPKNSLITPMCKDYARELGVSIKQEE